MKKFLLALTFGLLALAAMAEKRVQAVNYSDSRGEFIIVFVFDDLVCYRAATYPPSCPHYNASISVINETNVVVFSGQYTGGKCWEDKPSNLVSQAIGLGLGFTPASSSNVLVATNVEVGISFVTNYATTVTNTISLTYQGTLPLTIGYRTNLLRTHSVSGVIVAAEWMIVPIVTNIPVTVYNKGVIWAE